MQYNFATLTLKGSCTLPVQRDELREERETLVRNISCIFRTAQLELQRKDDQLKELRQSAAGIAKIGVAPS